MKGAAYRRPPGIRCGARAAAEGVSVEGRLKRVPFAFITMLACIGTATAAGLCPDVDKTPPSEGTRMSEETFEVPDGRTVVWYLGETTGRQHRFVLVTPRVRVREEPKERIFEGDIPPIPGR